MNPITIHTSITSSSNASIEHNHQHRSKRGGCKYPFPQRLFDLLEEADDDVEHNKHVLSSIISWNPNGKHFRVHNRKEFEKIIQKKYFNQSKYASFRRQLNLWGFERIPDQDEQDSSSISSLYGGCFFHPLFQRNSRSLCWGMEAKYPVRTLLCLVKDKVIVLLVQHTTRQRQQEVVLVMGAKMLRLPSLRLVPLDTTAA